MLFWKFEIGPCSTIPYVDPDMPTRWSAPSRIAGWLWLTAATRPSRCSKMRTTLLPLDPSKIKTIAVIGPNADRGLLGGYSGVPEHNVTVLDGIKAKVGQKVEGAL